MNYFYGPVPSRRLGFSLGVDLIPKKFCTFDCIYCQLGRTTKKTIKRFSYLDLDKFKKELKEIIKKNPKIDYITISGSGEPTLHKDLDKVILTIKEITKNKYPVCAITNSSLLYRDDVRRELKEADLIIPSLDAATPNVLRKINKPDKAINFKKIIDGLIKLRKGFKGKIWLEIMLVGGINDSLEEAKRFREIIRRVKPDKVQLNLPVRAVISKISLPNPKRIREIRKIIGKKVEIVAPFPSRKQDKFLHDKIKVEILKFLERRPMNLDDLVNSLGMNTNEIIKYLKSLLKEKKIKEYLYQGKRYFVVSDF